MTDLLALAEKETGLVLSFIALLRKEQEALQRGEASALPSFLEEKTKLVDVLNRLTVERNQFLGQQGLEKDKAGMQAWLNQNPSLKNLQKSWKKLLELAEEARELHRVNGRLITLHLQSTNDALEVLSQKMQKSLFYGPDGQSSSITGKRIIDSA